MFSFQELITKYNRFCRTKRHEIKQHGDQRVELAAPTISQLVINPSGLNCGSGREVRISRHVGVEFAAPWTRLAGNGHSNGGSVVIDFSDCAFYPAYYPRFTQLWSAVVTKQFYRSQSSSSRLLSMLTETFSGPANSCILSAAHAPPGTKGILNRVILRFCEAPVNCTVQPGLTITALPPSTATRIWSPVWLQNSVIAIHGEFNSLSGSCLQTISAPLHPAWSS